MRGRNLTARFGWTVAACLFAVAIFLSCTNLPEIGYEMQLVQSGKVEFEDKDGPVSSAQNDEILDSLEGKDGDTDILQRHLAYQQEVNIDSPLVLGNRVTLLEDGPETYQAMIAAIEAARDHINLETYIMEDDEIGRKFSDLLLKKRAQGVQINLIYDSFGSRNTPGSFFERLSDAGVQVVEFNPINPLADNAKPWLLNNRDHRKLLIIDGRSAFVGGINISNVYSRNPFSRWHRRPGRAGGWRDTHSRIEGPVVAVFQKLFLDTWSKQDGPPLQQRDYFPELDTEGDEIVLAIGNEANDEQSPIYRTLISAFTHAEQEIHLTIAYFAPDPQLREALTDAARRGVEVKLVLPSYTDSWTVFHVGRSYYGELLEAGVKIYERRSALMHAKSASIDGVWSTIGSTNLDWRSFLHNYELNAVILSRDFARQMNAMFLRDIAESKMITIDSWRKRPLLDRLKESMARLVEYWL